MFTAVMSLSSLALVSLSFVISMQAMEQMAEELKSAPYRYR